MSAQTQDSFRRLAGQFVFACLFICVAVAAAADILRLGLIAYGWVLTGAFIDIPRGRPLPSDLMFIGVTYLIWRDINR